MHFPLLYQGRRFFFLTLSVAGRRPVLSRLERGAKRPLLTPEGERIVAFWRRLHEIEPAYTASDFVIMPDHVHLLLIVYSADEFRFNPLTFVHRFMEATEGSWQWSRDYWVTISFESKQLSAIRRYIRMNPARFFWKLDHADMFKLHVNLRHPALNPTLPWSAMGDLTILASPFLYLVRLTMKKTPAELEDEVAAHVGRAKAGGVPVCGFLSPGEREFERRLKELPFSRWVKTVPYALPSQYDPSVEDSQWLASHREVILSSFEAEEAPPFTIARAKCLAMNERIAEMCARLAAR